jgi:hypothetical protein
MDGMIRVVLGLLVVLATAAAPACGSSLLLRANDVAVVNSPDNILNLRATPSANAPILFALPQGTRVRIIQPFDVGWMKVAVETLGDTGKKPAQDLVGFVNGKFLVVTRNDQMEYAAMKKVMEQYFDNPLSKINFSKIEIGSDGTKYYDINDCMVGSDYVPADARGRTRSFAALAFRIVSWSHFLPRLGYPENLWKPVGGLSRCPRCLHI